MALHPLRNASLLASTSPTSLALLAFLPLLASIAGASGCASPTDDEVTGDDVELNRRTTVANGEVLGGRNGALLAVSWLQWQDGTCTRPTNRDDSPWAAGKPAGSACRSVADCEIACNACPSTGASYLVRACVDHVCADAATAGALALEMQSRASFQGRELCR